MTITLEGLFADRATWVPRSCAIAKALEAIGPPSALLVLREAYFGTTRFDDFVQRLGMTESAVTARLRQLVDTGLLAKRPYKEPGQRTRYEYDLTQMGGDLLPALVSLMEWGETYLRGERGRLVSLTHAGCGEPVAAEIRCAKGHPVAPDDIIMRPARTGLR